MASNEEQLSDGVQRFHPTSRPNLIASLEIGESHAEAIRIPFENLSKEEFKEAAKKLQSTMAAARVRAVERTGYSYSTEIGDFRTRSDDFIITCVITRIS